MKRQPVRGGRVRPVVAGMSRLQFGGRRVHSVVAGMSRGAGWCQGETDPDLTARRTRVPPALLQ